MLTALQVHEQVSAFPPQLAAIPAYRYGFTKEQLMVLRNQIIAFKSIKKNQVGLPTA